MNPPLVVLKFGSSVLENCDCLPAVALVHQLGTNKVSGSRGVRRLSARGWVSVSVSNADKRVSSVALTDRGAWDWRRPTFGRG